VGGLAFVLRRSAEIPPTLFIISVLIFSLIHLAPGNPLAFMLGVEATPEIIRATEERYQLDRPLYEQYWSWLSRSIRGDLGSSIMTGQPVWRMIGERLPVTISLALTAAVLSWLFAFPAGVLSAARRHSTVDYTVSVASTIGLAIPDFITALVLILVFSISLRLLPSIGFVEPWTDPIGWARHIILPAFALGAIHTALLARMVRSSLLEVLTEDYVRVARSKGLSEGLVLWRHALRNALVPVITTIAINVAQLLGGSIIVEQVFAIPGIGRLLVDAVLRRDYPVIQGIVLLVGIGYILASLVADLLYAYLDPRIRQSMR
jgi:peptide/nickel transport system permease protein